MQFRPQDLKIVQSTQLDRLVVFFCEFEEFGVDCAEQFPSVTSLAQSNNQRGGACVFWEEGLSMESDDRWYQGAQPGLCPVSYDLSV